MPFRAFGLFRLNWTGLSPEAEKAVLMPFRAFGLFRRSLWNVGTLPWDRLNALPGVRSIPTAEARASLEVA